LFGKQHFRVFRTADEVDVLITDSPLLQNLAYIPKDYYLKSLGTIIREAYDRYDNLDIFLIRADQTEKAYNPKGRHQTYEEACLKDAEIYKVLDSQNINFRSVSFSRNAPLEIIDLMRAKGWNV
jgi:hypothetical protein